MKKWGRKTRLSRLEVFKNDGEYADKDAPWLLVCREDGDDGQWFEHGHSHDGHSFPVTAADLRRLVKDATKALDG